jgi:hypothetical protein
MILNFFPASVYNSNTPAMYSTLGINGGYMIDDFEGPTLLPGLSISLTGGVPATTWTSSVPNLSNGFDCGIPTWDGTHAVTNSVNNMLNSCQVPSGLANLTTFTYAPGTTSFGIGLVNFQSLSSPLFPLSDHELIVNGTAEMPTCASMRPAEASLTRLPSEIRLPARPTTWSSTPSHSLPSKSRNPQPAGSCFWVPWH